jgi:predicted GNAT family N-acyltransferase
MAVRKPWRGRGVGARLLAALIEAARGRGQGEVVLSAQLSARGFYARYGFEAEGDTFMDAGIEHISMRCVLSGGPLEPDQSRDRVGPA